jgi:hypothetical protein
VSFQQICVELHAWHDHVASREVLTSTLWKLALHVQWSTLVAFTPAEAFPGHVHATVLLDPEKEYCPLGQVIDWFLLTPGQYEFAGHTEHTGVRARRFLRLELCPATNVDVSP